MDFDNETGFIPRRDENREGQGMRWRLIKWLARFAVTLVIVAAFAGVWLFWRAMPSYSGTEKLPGLGAEARVWRDSYGVPHIFAANMDDAARALGYLHASERLFQMEVNRRVGQGRAAETFGPDLLKVDKFIRTLGFYREAESSVAALSPETQKRLQAYADGVNAFLDTHKDALPPEFLLAGVTPAPWKPADTVVWGKLIALELSQNREQEALRAHIAQKLGPDKIPWFFPGMKPGDPITTLPTLSERHASPDGVDDAIGALTGLNRGASNEWVISGARTVTGKPILANDPHLGLGAPILWYLARIVTPDGWIKGATVPGTPVVLLGQNDHIAWGITTANTDTQDLFVETIDPTDPTRYLTPDGPKPFETRDETIRVKGGADVKLTIRTTRHGPVLSDVSSDLASIAAPGKAIALAFTGLSDHDTTTDAALRLDAAKNWDDFLGAMRLYQSPTQNIVYADTSGDIGFFSPGLVPLRKSGDGLAPVDGASGASTGPGRSRSTNCRRSTIRTPASPSTPTTPMSPATISRPSGRTGTRASAPAASSSSWTRSTSTAWRRRLRCRPTTCRSRPRRCSRSSRKSPRPTSGCGRPRRCSRPGTG